MELQGNQDLGRDGLSAYKNIVKSAALSLAPKRGIDAGGHDRSDYESELWVTTWIVLKRAPDLPPEDRQKLVWQACRNRAKDLQRSSRRRYYYETGFQTEQELSYDPIARAEAREILDKLFKFLAEEDQKLIDQFLDLGSIRKLAQHTGVPPSTMSYRIRRIRKRLRKLGESTV